MTYTVIVEKTETGYSAYVPDLPGCISVGDTKDEVQNNISEAILFHLEGLREDKQDIPVPSTEALHLVVPNVA